MKHVFILTGVLVVGLVLALIVDAVLAAALLELREWREARREKQSPQRDAAWTSQDGRTVR